MDDLGAESIDLLDILFRIERSTGVKIQASDLGDYIQGGIPDDEFGDDERGDHCRGHGAPEDGHAADRRRRPCRVSCKAEEVIKHFTVAEPRADGQRACRRRLVARRFRVGVDIVSVDRAGAARRRERRNRGADLHAAGARRTAERERRGASTWPRASPPRRPCSRRLGTGLGRACAGPRSRSSTACAAGREVYLHGAVAAHAERHGIDELDVSLSHSAGLAVAQAVAVSSEERTRALPPDRPRRRIRAGPVGPRRAR